MKESNNHAYMIEAILYHQYNSRAEFQCGDWGRTSSINPQSVYENRWILFGTRLFQKTLKISQPNLTRSQMKIAIISSIYSVYT